MQTLAVTLPRYTADLVTFKDTRKLQHALSTHYHNYLYHQFTSKLSDQDLRVFNTACGNHAAAYLQAIPSEPALTLSNSEMLISLCHYLNISVVDKMGGNPELECYCNTKNIKCTDYHLLNCGGHDHFRKRHEAISNTILSLVGLANLTPETEGKCTANPNDTHRFDISIPFFNDLNYIHMDVTIVNALCNTYKASTLAGPNGTVKVAEQLKHAKYDGYIFQQEQFKPLALEAQGAIGVEFEAFLTTLSFLVGNKAPEQTTWAASTFKQYALQRVSCILRKSNAANILDTIRSTKKAHAPSRLNFPQLLDNDANPFANIVAEDEFLEVEDLDYDQDGNPVLGGDWQ
jgi:hypothetical protein